MTNNIYVGLGSNLAEPTQQLLTALSAIHCLPKTQLTAVSSLYASKPMGPQDQPDYVNAVARLTSTLPPLTLLDLLQEIEQKHGRQRKSERWGPRTLDLDILLFGDMQINDDRLTVPHYGMKTREFVLYPLAEITPDLRLPDGDTLAGLLKNCPCNGLTRMNIDMDNWFSRLKSV